MLRILKASFALMLSVSAFASPQLDHHFLGTYGGTGRACYGHLRLTARFFTWKSTFSSVENSRFEVLDQTLDATDPQVTLLIKKRTKGWLYPVVTLHHAADAPEYAWMVRGYQSMEDYQNHNDPETLGCLMVKED